jgi:hypothetical protein
LKCTWHGNDTVEAWVVPHRYSEFDVLHEAVRTLQWQWSLLWNCTQRHALRAAVSLQMRTSYDSMAAMLRVAVPKLPGPLPASVSVCLHVCLCLCLCAIWCALVHHFTSSHA